MAVTISFIVAVARNGVIGNKGDLPWRLSSDLKLFRRLTMGKPIVMGRKTWDSLRKKPLDGRDNIVVTRDPAFAADGAIVVRTVDDALQAARAAAAARGVDEIMVIGGAEIFRATLPAAARIYLTRVEAEPEGDVYLPPFAPEDWQLAASEPLPRGERDQYEARLDVLERRGNSN